MTEPSEEEHTSTPRIVVGEGPYHVYGNIPLVHKTQVVSEYGEPLTWKKDGVYKTGETYFLCRCGYSRDQPFCDRSHSGSDFDGTETADTHTFAERQIVDTGGEGIVVKKDDYLCMLSGFCANRHTNIDRMLASTAEPRIRAEIMAMIERCPSGAYAYSLAEDEADIEPDLPVQIAVTTEITSDGPIEGPLWVTGNIPIERADGEPFETRNRVTICTCGHSSRKPLCDGTHRALRQQHLRDEKTQEE